jgi:predicted transcriptional regulator
MKTMSVRLPDAVRASLQQEAEERRIPMNAVIIEALREHAQRQQKTRERVAS